MRKKLVLFVMIAALWVTIYAVTPVSVDVAHSTVGFVVPIAGGLSQVSGKFSQFDLKLNFDETDITKSTVETKIKVESIDTGIAARDNHLRTADFFEVAKYPEIAFVSKRVEKKGKDYILTGDFSMHGVTKEISFPFTIIGNCYDAKAKTVTLPCGFQANLKLDRREYGIVYARKDDPNFLGNIVDINLNLLAVRPRPRP